MALNNKDKNIIMNMLRVMKDDMYKFFIEYQNKIDCISAKIEDAGKEDEVHLIQNEVVPAPLKKTQNDSNANEQEPCEVQRWIVSQTQSDLEVSSTSENVDENASDSDYMGSINSNESSISALFERQHVPEQMITPHTESSAYDNNASISNDQTNFVSNDEWLFIRRPEKIPYFPQLGDEVVYFQQCHRAFFRYICSMNLYEVDESSMPWTKFDFQAYEFATVKEISFERKKQTRICRLKLERNNENGEKTDEDFDVDYHCVADDSYNFLILRQHFDAVKNWQIGNRFRRKVGNSWHFGKIFAVLQAQDPQKFPDSKFECLRIALDNTGFKCNVSPWDIEPIENEDISVISEDFCTLSCELNKELQDSRAVVYNHILREWDKIKENYSEWFDFLNYGDTKTEYPISFWIIRDRLKNLFYRRIESIKFDLRYFIKNFGKKIHTNIGYELLESVDKAIEDGSIIIDMPFENDEEERIEDIRINDEFSEGSQEANNPIISLSRSNKFTIESSSTEEDEDFETVEETVRDNENIHEKSETSFRRTRMNSDDNENCRQIWQKLYEDDDSVPFREPVDELKFRDYRKYVTIPMDLQTVKEDLEGQNYNNPSAFVRDIRLIFENSKVFNTTTNSKIYRMTERLSAKFERLMVQYFPNISSKITNSDTPKKRRQDTCSYSKIPIKKICSDL